MTQPIVSLDTLTSTQLIWFNKIEEDLLDFGITYVKDEDVTFSLELKPEPSLIVGKRDMYHVHVSYTHLPHRKQDYFYPDRKQAVLFYMNIVSEHQVK